MGRKLDSYTDEWGNLVRDEDLVILSNGSIYRVEYISDNYVNLSQDRNVWLHVPFSKEIPSRLTPNKPKEVEMKPWKDLTPDEKGALLLAYHEGKVIEWWYGRGKDFYVNGSSADKGLSPQWDDTCYYRVKPKPVVEEVVLYGRVINQHLFGGSLKDPKDTHKITFNLVDGEPDCNSIKMSKL